MHHGSNANSGTDRRASTDDTARTSIDPSAAARGNNRRAAANHAANRCPNQGAGLFDFERRAAVDVGAKF